MYETVLVTGGTGMTGTALKGLVGNTATTYIFVGSSDADLQDLSATRNLFRKVQPDAVIHLASVVGGLFYNMNNNAKLLDCNTRINLNVTKCCVEYGVKKALIVSTTCAFTVSPTRYPMTESDIHQGPVHSSNEGYGISKRIAEVSSRLYNNSSNTKFVTLYPCNLYGPNDNFNPKTCHVLSSLISRGHSSKSGDLIVWGSGTPLRQFLYVNDFARLILRVLEEFNGESMILCNMDELSINQLAEKIKNMIGLQGEIVHDLDKSDGLFRKTVSNSLLLKTFPDFQFTPLEEGLRETYSWFREFWSTRGKITGNIPGCKGLAGGIGNQLFLISTILTTAWDNGLNPFLRFDYSLKYQYLNDYKKTLFEQFDFLDDEDTSAYCKVEITKGQVTECKGNTIIEGYFQSPVYFERYRNRIIDILTLDLPPEVSTVVGELRRKYRGKQLIGIQVRRGDYKQLGWELSLQYYKDSMQRFDRRNTIFIITTDDKEWCHQNLPLIDVLQNSDYVDFFVMSRLDGLIISNSTFGWWAAYISRSNNVVVPCPWFKNNRFDKELYLDGWQKQNW
jgi:GDP-L-fucose synthase